MLWTDPNSPLSGGIPVNCNSDRDDGARKGGGGELGFGNGTAVPGPLKSF